MALKRKDNGSTAEASARAGYSHRENDAVAEAAALDQLPNAIRRRLAVCNAPISTPSILDVYRKGASVTFILDAIEQAERRDAIANGTMPGDYWRGAKLHLTAPADRRESAATGDEPRRVRMDRKRPRRLPRPSGSY